MYLQVRFINFDVANDPHIELLTLNADIKIQFGVDMASGQLRLISDTGVIRPENLLALTSGTWHKLYFTINFVTTHDPADLDKVRIMVFNLDEDLTFGSLDVNYGSF